MASIFRLDRKIEAMEDPSVSELDYVSNSLAEVKAGVLADADMSEIGIQIVLDAVKNLGDYMSFHYPS